MLSQWLERCATKMKLHRWMLEILVALSIISLLLHLVLLNRQASGKTVQVQNTKWFRHGDKVPNWKAKFVPGFESSSSKNLQDTSFAAAENSHAGKHDIVVSMFPDAMQYHGKLSERKKQTKNRTLAQSVCQPKRNLMFLKTHKTAGTTLQSVLNRHGYLHELSMVFSKHNFKNGHLRYKKLNENSPRKLFLPRLHERDRSLKFTGYNMSTGHIRFDRKVMNTFMAKGTKYITILREPSSQWISAFHHLGLENLLRRIDDGRFENYTTLQLVEMCMRNPVLCVTIDGENSPMVPLYRNNQFFDLGQEDTDDVSTIKEKILSIAKEVDLVLIADYFDESMVLLKHLMCWNYQDIVYAPKNQVVDRIPISTSLREKILNWNTADAMLYQYFNRTFWRKIKRLGQPFQIQLERFQQVERQKFKECVGGKAIVREIGFEHLEYFPHDFSSEFCMLMVEDHDDLFRRLFHRQFVYGRIF